MKIDHTQGLVWTTGKSLSPILECSENPFRLFGLVLVDRPVERRVCLQCIRTPQYTGVRKASKKAQGKDGSKRGVEHSERYERPNRDGESKGWVPGGLANKQKGVVHSLQWTTPLFIELTFGCLPFHPDFIFVVIKEGTFGKGCSGVVKPSVAPVAHGVHHALGLDVEPDPTQVLLVEPERAFGVANL